MQKLNEKKILGTVPKNYQMLENFWDCPEFSRKLQNKKGITLIALIITVIVMLILVGVTINVALNGGLFQKAEIATKETEEKAILEEMISMMEITDDGKINAQAIIDKMEEKYTVEGSLPNVTITGKLGKYNYEVSEKAIKIVQEEEDLGEYYLKLMHRLVEGVTEEQAENAYNELLNLSEQGLLYCFNYSTNNNEDHYYFYIKGYNYDVFVEDEDENKVTISLLTKGSDEYNKVNSLVEECKTVEEELNKLLIGTGYTYTLDDDRNGSIKEYIANGLSDSRGIRVYWQAGNFDLYIKSSIDNRVEFGYNVYSDLQGNLLDTQQYVVREIENNHKKI